MTYKNFTMVGAWPATPNLLPLYTAHQFGVCVADDDFTLLPTVPFNKYKAARSLELHTTQDIRLTET